MYWRQLTELPSKALNAAHIPCQPLCCKQCPQHWSSLRAGCHPHSRACAARNMWGTQHHRHCPLHRGPAQGTCYIQHSTRQPCMLALAHRDALGPNPNHLGASVREVCTLCAPWTTGNAYGAMSSPHAACSSSARTGLVNAACSMGSWHGKHTVLSAPPDQSYQLALVQLYPACRLAQRPSSSLKVWIRLTTLP